MCSSDLQVEESNFDSESSEWIGIQGEWISTHSRDSYLSYVEDIRSAIERGLVYQANACRILKANCNQSLSTLFSKILHKNPAPYAAYFFDGVREIASASPELFLSISNGQLKSSPIKGTASTRDFKDKDLAENVKIGRAHV